VFSTLYSGDDSALVAAPTGSGKTLCAEFAILRMLSQHEAAVAAAEASPEAPVPPLRAVYVASKAAIVKERFRDWSARLGQGGLGLSVVMLTGEMQVKGRGQGSG